MGVECRGIEEGLREGAREAVFHRIRGGWGTEGGGVCGVGAGLGFAKGDATGERYFDGGDACAEMSLMWSDRHAGLVGLWCKQARWCWWNSGQSREEADSELLARKYSDDEG